MLLIVEPSPLRSSTLVKLSDHGWGLCHVELPDYMMVGSPTNVNSIFIKYHKLFWFCSLVQFPTMLCHTASYLFGTWPSMRVWFGLTATLWWQRVSRCSLKRQTGLALINKNYLIIYHWFFPDYLQCRTRDQDQGLGWFMIVTIINISSTGAPILHWGSGETNTQTRGCSSSSQVWHRTWLMNGPRLMDFLDKDEFLYLLNLKHSGLMKPNPWETGGEQEFLNEVFSQKFSRDLRNHTWKSNSNYSLGTCQRSWAK